MSNLDLSVKYLQQQYIYFI